MEALGASAVFTLLAACSDDTRAAMPSSTLDDPPPSYEPTFGAIYSEVFNAANCTLGLCHGEGAAGGGLDLFPKDNAYADLVGVPSTSPKCGGLAMSLVVPGNPEQSLLYLKLSLEPPCGDPMPPGEPLEDRQLNQVRLWIERGALDD